MAIQLTDFSSFPRKYKWLILAITVHFTMTMFLGLSRHWGYLSSINDLGMFDQALWNSLNQKTLINTILTNQPINWLGFHFNPVLFLFVPFYAIIPSAIWFVIAQALALSITAWPIFLLTKRVGLDEQTGVIWCLVYFLNPFLFNAAVSDFHPISLAVPFTVIGMLSIEKNDFRLLFISCVFILLCQEHLGLMVAGFGVLWWIRTKRLPTAVVLIIIGLFHFCLVLGVVMPALSPTNEHFMFGKGAGQLNRYNWLGDSLTEIIKTIIFHPVLTVSHVFSMMGVKIYLCLLFLFFVGFPFAAPEFLLPALADLMANILSANPMPRSPLSYHSVNIVPIFTIAAIFGSLRISNRFQKITVKELAGLVLVTCGISWYCLLPLPLPGAINYWNPIHVFNKPDPNIPKIQLLIGQDASVSAQANIGAHFSQRPEIYCYPNKADSADVIILRLHSPTNNLRRTQNLEAKDLKYVMFMLDNHLQMNRNIYLNSIASLLKDKNYSILLWKDPWLVMRRNNKNNDNQMKKEVILKLETLRLEWKNNE